MLVYSCTPANLLGIRKNLDVDFTAVFSVHCGPEILTLLASGHHRDLGDSSVALVGGSGGRSIAQSWAAVSCREPKWLFVCHRSVQFVCEASEEQRGVLMITALRASSALVLTLHFNQLLSLLHEA